MTTYNFPFRFRLLILSGLLLLSSAINAQEAEEEKSSFWDKLVDTFIDKDISRWSFRGLANYKDNQYRLLNDDYKLEYVAGNPSGIGFGIANSKLVVDIIFNMKLDDDRPTQRFDMQGNLMLGRTYVNFQVQDYDGYQVTNTDIDDPGVFRPDIKSFSLSLNGLYLFNEDVPHLEQVFTGIDTSHPGAGTFVAGGYFEFHDVKADSSVVPESSRELFNEFAQMTRLEQYGFGVQGGYSYFCNLPLNLMLSLTLAPGVGISIKDIQTESGISPSPNVWETSLYTLAQLGYNSPRWYVHVSNNNQWYWNSLGNGNRGGVNGIKVKLAVGYKFRKQS